ncbi:MAG TPA: hypothetical protein P5121_16285 [Caldilineaceae bacterium]|nr:hypothetical protein [Caldilineaceae bacterium]
MYVVMKDGQYFTGMVARTNGHDLRWTRHIAGAKVWQEKRAWAQQAAHKWQGTVVEIKDKALVPSR